MGLQPTAVALGQRRLTNFAVSLIGPQGSGKSTQIAALEAAGFSNVVMSKLITAEKERNPEFMDLAARYMSRGQLVPTKFVMPILWRHFENMQREITHQPALIIDAAEGRDCGQEQEGIKVVLDGMPRDEEQAEALEGYLGGNQYHRSYIFLDMTYDESLARIRKRVEEMLARGETPRGDDLDEDAVKNRLDIYYDRLPKITRYLEGVDARIIRVDARLSKKIVSQHILDAVGIPVAA